MDTTRATESNDDTTIQTSSTPNHCREQLLTGWKQGATGQARWRDNDSDSDNKDNDSKDDSDDGYDNDNEDKDEGSDREGE
jgi:hypothetical protein